MNNSDLKRLIDEYTKLDINKTSYEPTIMELSGYPYYENVCSNILSFFFDTSQPHNMKDLFIRALFNVIGEDIRDIVVNEVIREQITPEGKRLDLVILTDVYVVGIENKIFAGLYNDLENYSKYLNGILNNRKLMRVILSINKIPNISHNFVNVTYSELFEAIDNLIADYWKDIKDKYFIFLKDFIKTINNLGGNNMDPKAMNYISANLEDVEEFMKLINDLKRYLKQRVNNLSSIVKYNSGKCKRWFYRESETLGEDLVHDISIEDATVAIDTWYKPDKWIISIWLRKKGKNKLSNKLDLCNWLELKGVNRNEINICDNSRDVLVKEFKDMDGVSVYLEELLSKLCN